MPKTIAIAGGTGFVGKHLTRLLIDKEYEVIVFTRHLPQKSAEKRVKYALWSPEKQEIDTESLQKADVIVNLSGEGIADKRWTKNRKKSIVSSRVDTTSLLVKAAKKIAHCETFISASAIGFYGPDRDNLYPFTENASPYPGFLGDTCQQWEAAAKSASDTMRTVILRFGIVLGKESGAFPQFARPQSLGVVPILGGGKQVVSWIEVADLAAMILYAIENNKIDGIYNAVAPNPVSNKTLMRTIARVKGGIKIPVPVPAFILKIMLGEMSEEVLKSCTVSAKKIEDTGFAFRYGEIERAVRQIMGK